MSSSILNKLRGNRDVPSAPTKVDPVYVEKLAAALDFAADNFDLVPEVRVAATYVTPVQHQVNGALLGKLLKEKIAEKQQNVIATAKKADSDIISNILARVRGTATNATPAPTSEPAEQTPVNAEATAPAEQDDEPGYVLAEDDPVEQAAAQQAAESANEPVPSSSFSSASLADLMAAVSTGGAKGTSDSAAVTPSQDPSTKTASARGQGPMLARADGDVLRRLRERTATVK